MKNLSTIQTALLKAIFLSYDKKTGELMNFFSSAFDGNFPNSDSFEPLEEVPLDGGAIIIGREVKEGKLFFGVTAPNAETELIVDIKEGNISIFIDRNEDEMVMISNKGDILAASFDGTRIRNYGEGKMNDAFFVKLIQELCLPLHLAELNLEI